MPSNKNINSRIQILDRCFSDFGCKYTFEDLLDIVNNRLKDNYLQGISIRTLRDDISTIRRMLPNNVQLKAYKIDRNLSHYRYTKEGFSIYKNELSPQEVESLRSTIEMLGKYRGLPSNRWLEGVISNLEVRFGISAQAETVVCFGQNENLKGLEYLSDLITSTIKHQTLEILYRPTEDKEYLHTLHPYFLKQYNERWFLFGLDNKEMRIKILALDRIYKVNKSNETFVPNNFIDFNTCFDNFVGVTIPQKLELKEIHLKFSKQRFKYVTSKKIHKSQKIVSYDDCIISLYVCPTQELEQQIFSFGPDVEVLSPPEYREDFSKKIAICMKKYMSVQ